MLRFLRHACFLFVLPAVGAAALQPVGAVVGVERIADGVRLTCADGSTVSCRLLATDLARVQVRFPGENANPPASWAIAQETWPAVDWRFEESAEAVTLTTAALQVVLRRAPLLIAFREPASGREFNADQRPMARDPETGRLEVAKRLGLEERFYGLGEKAAPLEKRRGRFTMWNSDTPGYELGTDPIYQSIPFHLGSEDGRFYGLFYDNSFRTTFDFGHTGQEAAVFGAEGGEIDYYFFAGPAPKTILGRYTELTGRMPLPPLWALGNQQSRYSYYPAALVEQIAESYRAHDLPLDVVYLDIHYMNGYRVFTWDPAHFPDPAGLMQRLGARGVKVVTIVDPGVKLQPPEPGAADRAVGPEFGPQDRSYYVYNEGAARDFFLRRRDGSVYVGEVWPGRSVFVDYSREDARQWWGDLHRSLVEPGVAGIWTDMNEPSDFLDKTGATQTDVIFDDRGARSPYARHRNLFALNMARATYEGLARLQPDRRPFVITRAGYAGIQRFATVWTGDNNATWESLALNIPMFASLGLSGEAFVGADVPGFIGRASPELLVRNYQVAFLTPLLRNHAAMDNYDHEPWRFGPVYTDIIRKYLRLRYELLPFLYTTLEEAHRTGVPLFRPLVLNFPEDPNTAALEDQFMVGDALMAAPVLHRGERARDVYLPAGRWYELGSGAAVSGGRLMRVDAPLDHVPLYVRGGSILPTTVAMRHVGERPWDPLRFSVFPAEDGTAAGTLYEDDGLTPRYREGQFRRTRVVCARQGEGWRVQIEVPEGAFVPPPRSLELRLPPAMAGNTVSLDGGALNAAGPETAAAGWRRDSVGWLVVRLPDDGRKHVIEIR